MAFKQPVTDEELAEVVRGAVGPAVHLVGARELTEGSFNAAYALALSDGRTAVLKVAPRPGTPLLTYEQRLLHTEALCLRTFAARTTAPQPQLLFAGLDGEPIGRAHLLTSVLPGASWASQAHRIDPVRRRALRRQLGSHVAAMHAVTGPGPFGYPAPGSPLVGTTWSQAYQRIVDALLADAHRFAVPLPRPAAQLREVLLTAAGEVLDAVTTPVLVHFDLWEGNVFVDLDHPAPAVTGSIDHERALWADPAADFASLALFGDVGQDPDFLAGYREGGGPVVLDDATAHRLHLYRAHLALVMLVETAPRGTTGPEHERHTTRVSRWLDSQVTALARR